MQASGNTKSMDAQPVICKDHNKKVQSKCNLCNKSMCSDCIESHLRFHAMKISKPFEIGKQTTATSSTERDYGYFQKVMQSCPCYCDFDIQSCVLNVYNLKDKERLTLLLPHDTYSTQVDPRSGDVFYQNQTVVIFIKAKLLSISLSFAGYSYGCKAPDAYFSVVDLMQMPFQQKCLKKMEEEGDFWTLCNVKNQYAYAFQSLGGFKYSINNEKTTKVPTPQTGKPFATYPVLIQDRFIIGLTISIRDKKKTTSYFSLDILDECAGWSLLYEQTIDTEQQECIKSPVLAEASNQSVYIFSEDLSVKELFLFPKEQVKAPVLVSQGLGDKAKHDIRGRLTTSYIKNIWLLADQFSWKFLCFSYVTKNYIKVKSKDCFKEYQIKFK